MLKDSGTWKTARDLGFNGGVGVGVVVSLEAEDRHGPGLQYLVFLSSFTRRQ